MKRLRMTPAIRISLGLAIFTMTLLMGAEMMGIIPEPYKAMLDMRKKVCESLAIYASLAVQHGDLQAIEATMEVLKHRNPDILSSALRKADGRVLAMVGDHPQHWRMEKGGLSTPTNVQVPIFKGNTRWGNFEVSFKAVHGGAAISLWNRPIIKLIVIVIPLAFIGYVLFMKKTLRHLDPSAVVPGRVKAALDSLVEGVVLLDNQERIVLANAAFEKNVGQSGQSLVGQKASELKWTTPRSQEPVKEFPWQQALREGGSQSAVALTLRKSKSQARTFMVNGAPILDGAGKTRGALATFDDVTQLEQQNTELQEMLEALQRSRDEIHRQNQELQILATQDPLTGCLNRRAFFERFEGEYNRAQRHGHALACIMLDIDHFKSINDNHGHPVGDKVLQKLSSFLRDCVRDSDVICRYGGEEFCLVLPETTLKAGLQTAERIRVAIASVKISGIQVTISLGVSSLESEPGNPSELLSQADKALYEAKNTGRNRVVCYRDALDQDTAKELKAGVSGEGEASEVQHYIPHHVVKALMRALEHRDAATAEHCRQVGDLCVAAAHGKMSLNESFVLEIAGMLHDIGKIGVPDSILLKPGPLTEQEWQIMHDHEQKSVDVIASTFLSPELVEIVKYHRTWYDGSSSPGTSGPKGKDIPLGARILCIADAFSAMVSPRPYRHARSYEEAFEELRRCAGTQFDPDMVEHFIGVVQARDESRRIEAAPIPNSIQLEIGREVEKLFVAINTSAMGSLSLTAEQLAMRATQYGLTQLAETAKEVGRASAENRDQLEIVQLTSKLMQLYGNNENFNHDVGNLRKTYRIPKKGNFDQDLADTTS